jgi:hypothetical protein
VRFLNSSKFAKSFPPQGEKNLDDFSSNQRSNNGNERLGFVSKTSKKKNKNKKKKGKVTGNGVSGPKETNFA